MARGRRMPPCPGDAGKRKIRRAEIRGFLNRCGREKNNSLTKPKTKKKQFANKIEKKKIASKTASFDRKNAAGSFWTEGAQPPKARTAAGWKKNAGCSEEQMETKQDGGGSRTDHGVAATKGGKSVPKKMGIRAVFVTGFA